LFGVPKPEKVSVDLNAAKNSTLEIKSCASGAVHIFFAGAEVPSSQVGYVEQPGGPPLCWVKYRNITIQPGVRFTIVNTENNEVLALLATGNIAVNGSLEFHITGEGPAPGGSGTSVIDSNTGKLASAGGGGGGARYRGGYGGERTYSGGGTIP